MFTNAITKTSQNLQAGGGSTHCIRNVLTNQAAGRNLATVLLGIVWYLLHPQTAMSQSVGLPAPRLLTICPMGGQVGQVVEVQVAGEHLDDFNQLKFSDPRLVAEPSLDAQQQLIPGRFRIAIPKGLQSGLVDAYAVSKLGASTNRVFMIGELPEVVQTAACTSAAQSLSIEPNCTVNAATVERSINHYRITCDGGQQLRIDCAARGIESKLDPVLILSDASGRVLCADRLGNGLDYRSEIRQELLLKVHDATYRGGNEFFYRLSVQAYTPPEKPLEFDRIRHVWQYSWPAACWSAEQTVAEAQHNSPDLPQTVTIPCQIQGAFYPAADVDCFQFSAKGGDKLWIELASHRLGANTGPAALIQRSVAIDPKGQGQQDLGEQQWEDVLELKDIPPPLKVSTNNYAYDGPAYNGGSTDLIGALDVPQDGNYRIQVNDLFGGTRDDPKAVYQLMIRRASPDFALTGWVKHMELRNGDRNALSKPLALRPGGTVAIEVGAFRRDGFEGPIHLSCSGLPNGVTADTIDIPEGQNSGTVLLTADIHAPKGLGHMKIVGQSKVGEELTERECQLASMTWPVRDHWQEFPRPRLLKVIPVSVTDAEPATITVQTPRDENGHHVIRAKAGATVVVPLNIERRCQHLGSVLLLNTMGSGFQGLPKFEIPLQQDAAEAKLDLAALKVPPGKYTIAFYGPVVAKYEDRLNSAGRSAEPLEIVEMLVTRPFVLHVLQDSES